MPAEWVVFCPDGRDQGGTRGKWFQSRDVELSAVSSHLEIRRPLFISALFKQRGKDLTFTVLAMNSQEKDSQYVKGIIRSESAHSPVVSC